MPRKYSLCILLVIIVVVMLKMERSFSFIRRNYRYKVQRLLASTTSPPLNQTPKEAKNKKKAAPSKYSQTVLLPTTNFDQRANAAKKEPEIQQWWADNKIYDKLYENNPGEKFILHDGPPYANGNLHIGHALNKILKDFINRYYMLQGRKVRYVPGWDCHGLPIELKVLQSLKQSEREQLTPLSLRKMAAEFAVSTMQSQCSSFQRYGIWGDWDKPYLTLQPEYEAAQIRVFGKMVEKGHIYRGNKPVYWSPSSRTALAEAELEYPEGHVSRSIYVAFPITAASPALQAILTQMEGATSTPVQASLAIWTTTPWTIPANQAVAVNDRLVYCLVSHAGQPDGSRPILVAKELLNTLAGKLFGKEAAAVEGSGWIVHGSLTGEELARGTVYSHPLYPDQAARPVVIGGDYITTESGTGLVHTAPGHGSEDYLTGLKHGLTVVSPVDDAGKYTKEISLEGLEGLFVLKEGNTAVIQLLNSSQSLLLEEKYLHKYPYDWRTKQPVLVRATSQWFASLSSTFRQEALDAIDRVTWIPAGGRNRIYGMTEQRGDWCISRQRSWGVPIPVFFDKETAEPLMNQETLQHIEEVFRKEGSDAWWARDVADLLPPGSIYRQESERYVKGTDTMDVWFDSGTSWAGVAQAREMLSYPVDLYLEGSDQSRGWFQSSLLTAVAATGTAPYRTVLTHGFVLDEKGEKMSKSIGNVVDPMVVIAGGKDPKIEPVYGADTLRMWVSGVDYTADVCVGPNILKQVSEYYRKIRNTLRYLLGSLNDFDPAVDRVAYADLAAVDKYMLGEMTKALQEVEKAYASYQFYKVNAILTQIATVDLSSFYLDISKDRLYISSKSSARRKSCQTVLQIILDQLTVMIAPILPHLAEEIWQHLPYPAPSSATSVFERGWITQQERYPVYEEDFWQKIRLLRDDANKVMELGRQAKEIGASMECSIVLHSSDAAFLDQLRKIQGDAMFLPSTDERCSTNAIDDLRFLLMVSQVHIADSAEAVIEQTGSYHLTAQQATLSGLTVGMKKANGKKCDRCWYYSDSVGHDHDHAEICARCAHEVKTDGYVV